MAETAALIGDPSRANMLAVLLGGRSMTASELAHAAGIAAATASGHLSKLTAGGLLRLSARGRHRYYALASGDVARMIEGIMVVAEAGPARRRATPRVPCDLVECRSCYDHMAGRLAVALTDGLVCRGAIVLDAEAGAVTERGHALLRAIGLDVAVSGRRMVCRPCLDWSERRPHLAGALGGAILTFALQRDWVRRLRDSRALIVTSAGRQGFRDLFGVDESAACVPPPRQAFGRAVTTPNSTT